MKLHVAVDVGCLECGEESGVIGIYSNKKVAEIMIQIVRDNHQRHWQGEHSFFVETVTVQ